MRIIPFAGEGFFRDSNLWGFAAQIGSQWMDIGYELELTTDFMDMLKKDYPLNCKEQAFRMLRKWAQMHMNDHDCIQVFTKALTNAGRKDLADSFTQSFNDGHNNFKLSMKRRKLIDN
ncbi:p53-induced death domain-containing protein 1-like [Ciona intestinalis]